MDLVDEQHVALVELGEDRRQVAGPLERRARRDVQGARPSRRRRSRPASSCRARAARRTAGGGRLGRGGGRPRGRSPSAPSARAGRRTRPAAAAAGRPRRDPRRRGVARLEELVTHGAPRQLERVAQQALDASAARRQLAQRFADLLGRVAEAASASRTSPTADAPTRRHRRVEHRHRQPALQSSSRRSAVLLPDAGHEHERGDVAVGDDVDEAAGGWVARIAIASAGPTPWVAISVWNVARSSRVAKP